MSQQPCLPVSLRRKRQESGSEVDFSNVESMDADEYLAAVVQQASTLPNVFVASNTTATAPPVASNDNYVPIDGSAASLSYLVSEKTALIPPPSLQHVPPSRAWVETTLANFTKLRAYLEECHKEGVGGKATSRISVPPLKDRCGWHVFCVGLDEAQGNVGSYYDDNDNETMEDEQQEELPQWRLQLPKEGFHTPSVRLALQMDQVMVRRVLQHVVHYYVNGTASVLSQQRAAWLYALLARLDCPIHRDDAATLYSLLKTLTVTRANIPVERRQEELARLNTLIAIVGLYFEQGGGYNNLMTLGSGSTDSS